MRCIGTRYDQEKASLKTRKLLGAFFRTTKTQLRQEGIVTRYLYYRLETRTRYCGLNIFIKIPLANLNKEQTMSLLNFILFFKLAFRNEFNPNWFSFPY